MIAAVAAVLGCTFAPVAMMVTGGWFATRHARPENRHAR
jgi:hypothetical protein